MELNREQIIKALEWCSELRLCVDCPMRAEGYFSHSGNACRKALMENALSLIKELTEERDGFENLIHTMSEIENRMSDTIEELTEENERLENALIEQSAENVMLCGEVKHARADTVMKMQEEARQRCFMVGDEEFVALYDLDQIAKEMIGETNGN